MDFDCKSLVLIFGYGGYGFLQCLEWMLATAIALIATAMTVHMNGFLGQNREVEHTQGKAKDEYLCIHIRLQGNLFVLLGLFLSNLMDVLVKGLQKNQEYVSFSRGKTGEGVLGESCFELGKFASSSQFRPTRLGDGQTNMFAVLGRFFSLYPTAFFHVSNDDTGCWPITKKQLCNLARL